MTRNTAATPQDNKRKVPESISGDFRHLNKIFSNRVDGHGPVQSNGVSVDEGGQIMTASRPVRAERARGNHERANRGRGSAWHYWMMRRGYWDGSCRLPSLAWGEGVDAPSW